MDLGAPLGILSLQLTCSAHSAGEMLAAWGIAGMHHARLSLLWDCPYAIAYGLALSGLAWRLAHRAVLAWLPLLAAGLDLLENACHLMLLSAPAGPWALPACLFALAKWGLLGCWFLALVWLLLVGHRRSV